jgi:lipopolysaccharide/colanic/teichoic acid biosynthesis glycosyltransferase
VKYRRENEILSASVDPRRTYVEEVMGDKIRINLEYAATATFWSDFRVVLLTLGLLPSPRE